MGSWQKKKLVQNLHKLLTTENLSISFRTKIIRVTSTDWWRKRLKQNIRIEATCQWKCFIYSQIKHFHFFTAVFVLKKFCFRVVFKTITPKFTPKAHFYYTKNSVRKIFLVEFFYAFCLLLQKIMRNLLRKFAFLSRLFFYISAFCIIVIISFWGNLLFKKNFY